MINSKMISLCTNFGIIPTKILMNGCTNFTTKNEPSPKIDVGNKQTYAMEQVNVSL